MCLRAIKRVVRMTASEAGRVIAAVAVLAVVTALLAHNGAGPQQAVAQTTPETEVPECKAGLVVKAGESCVYPDTNQTFSVDKKGRASFLIFQNETESIETPEFRINGRVWMLTARALGNDSWLIETAGTTQNSATQPQNPETQPSSGPLKALSVSGLDIGQFDPANTEYQATWNAAVRQVTVEARATDENATVVIFPPDADIDSSNGHQINLFRDPPSAMTTTIVVTVFARSGDFSRYRVALPNRTPKAFYSTALQELSQDGVLTGCAFSEDIDADGFCGEDPIDRKTLAVWVVRVLDGKDPAAVTDTRFEDVEDLPASWWPFIERLAELGHTTGCGDGSNYCGDRNITRAEMAVFLSRAFDLPAGPDPNFADVSADADADAWYFNHVAALKASGITTGCGDGSNFCGDEITTRAEMATFLHRAKTFADSKQ